MTEGPPSQARDAEARGAVRVGARDLGVGCHPVVWMHVRALFRCEQGEDGGWWNIIMSHITLCKGGKMKEKEPENRKYAYSGKL